MKDEIVGEYPYNIEIRDNVVVHFESKENPASGTVFNPRFRVDDNYRINRIKELIAELSQINR